ncbi:MAG: PqqD family peptide modification chaperone [Ruminococcus sp.]|nr:PqqD family peptide modification chaperone [Ruminococcus sp.]
MIKTDFLLTDYLNLERQFIPFQKEGGKLPSFSVVIQPLVAEKIRKLNDTQRVGDYTFFEATAEGHWFSFCGSYCCVNKIFTHANVYLSDKLRSDGQYEASNLLMQAYMYRLVDTGNIMIHSAAVNFNHNAILFCGSSGAGKSTQANLWKYYLHADMLNYDKPCIINDNGRFYAHGSPWSGKEALYLNEFAPLKAIVFVNQAKENRVVRLSPAQAYAHIYLHNYVYPVTQDIEKKYAAAVKETVAHMPVYELYCDISETAVEVLFNKLFSNITYRDYQKEYSMKYKVKDCFEMKQIADDFIVIPRGKEALNFNATVVLNESGAFLWNLLVDYTEENALVNALMNHYSIDKELAEKDIAAFLKKMQENDMIDIIK